MPMKTNWLGAAASLLALAACGAPGGTPADPEIRVDPTEERIGAEVLVTARGLPPATPVEIGFGPPRSEYEVLARSTSDAGGRVAERVRVPSWAEAGRRYVFVAAEADAGPGRTKLVSEPFLVSDPNP